MKSKKVMAWILGMLVSLCLGSVGAQETVKVCPSCGGPGQMHGGVCIQCRGQKAYVSQEDASAQEIIAA